MFSGIIVFFIALQKLADKDRTRDKQQICCNNYRDDVTEKHGHGGKRFFNGDCKIICNGKNYQTRDAQKPICFGNLFAFAFTVKK